MAQRLMKNVAYIIINQNLRLKMSQFMRIVYANYYIITKVDECVCVWVGV